MEYIRLNVVTSQDDDLVQITSVLLRIEIQTTVNSV